MNNGEQHKIVIIGGGAGGLELATSLGRRFGKKGLAAITLIDAKLTHVWKPLLHEIAAGTMNSTDEELSYLAQGHWNHFRFRLGRVHKIDRQAKRVMTLATEDENGKEYIPPREFDYDTLVVAVGSLSNDFNIDGVGDNCYFIDQQKQAQLFHQHLFKRCYTAHAQDESVGASQLHIAIAGAGATGVELAAELYDSTRQLIKFGLDRIDADLHLKITIIEASQRILPGLPEYLSASVHEQLEQMGVDVLVAERITKVTEDGFHTESGKFIPAAIRVWAAGIKAPTF